MILMSLDRLSTLAVGVICSKLACALSPTKTLTKDLTWPIYFIKTICRDGHVVRCAL